MDSCNDIPGNASDEPNLTSHSPSGSAVHAASVGPHFDDVVASASVSNLPTDSHVFNILLDDDDGVSAVFDAADVWVVWPGLS